MKLNAPYQVTFWIAVLLAAIGVIAKLATRAASGAKRILARCRRFRRSGAKQRVRGRLAVSLWRCRSGRVSPARLDRAGHGW